MFFYDTFYSLISKDIGIDLGTCNTLVYVKNEGVVLSEPSVVAVYKTTAQDGQAVGDRAKRMVGRTPGDVSVVRPIKDGVIADFEMTEAMLTYFIRKVHRNSTWAKPRVIISVPSGITEVEQRAVKISAQHAKARQVWVVPEPIVAALGVGLPIADPVGSMIVDIGGGTTEVAVISMTGMVYSKSLRVAGDELDEAIANYLRRQYNFIIGETTAERIKIEIGSVFPLAEEMSLDVMGRDQVKGLPRSLTIRSEEIREALKDPVDQIVGVILETLEHCPPELAGDICARGITLAGGGALLRGLDSLLAKETRGIPIHVADDPLTAVVRGTGIMVDNLDRFRVYLDSINVDY